MNQQIIDAIQHERAYQDAKWGDNPHDVIVWIRIMQRKLSEATHADSVSALADILQAVAVGVACLEQHGVIERDTQHLTEPILDWAKATFKFFPVYEEALASRYVKSSDDAYERILCVQRLSERYHSGERTPELYAAMMGVE